MKLIMENWNKFLNEEEEEEVIEEGALKTLATAAAAALLAMASPKAGAVTPTHDIEQVRQELNADRRAGAGIKVEDVESFSGEQQYFSHMAGYQNPKMVTGKYIIKLRIPQQMLTDNKTGTLATPDLLRKEMAAQGVEYIMLMAYAMAETDGADNYKYVRAAEGRKSPGTLMLKYSGNAPGGLIDIKILDENGRTLTDEDLVNVYTGPVQKITRPRRGVEQYAGGPMSPEDVGTEGGMGMQPAGPHFAVVTAWVSGVAVELDERDQPASEPPPSGHR